jgi:hypothetical protein
LSSCEILITFQCLYNYLHMSLILPSLGSFLSKNLSGHQPMFWDWWPMESLKRWWGPPLHDAPSVEQRCFRFRLGDVSWSIGICFKISERSKSTSITFLYSGFHSTFGGRTSPCSTPWFRSFITTRVISLTISRPKFETKSFRACLPAYNMSSIWTILTLKSRKYKRIREIFLR